MPGTCNILEKGGEYLKRIVTIVIGVALIVGVLSFYMSPTSQRFEDKLCNQIAKLDSACSKVFYVDNQSNLVIYRNDSYLMLAKMNESLSKVEDLAGGVDLQSFLNASDFLIWKGNEYSSGESPMISGLARYDVKSIIIESEDNIQPNKIYVGDGIWFWYVELIDSEKLNLPITIKAYDKNGEQLN